MSHSLTIGALALQGDFREHIAILKQLANNAALVSFTKQLT